jgi:hypothetical protein
MNDAFRGLSLVESIEPETNKADYLEAYDRWFELLKQTLHD